MPYTVRYNDGYLAHYGKGHLQGGHSGRYPWGSGEEPGNAKTRPASRLRTDAANGSKIRNMSRTQLSGSTTSTSTSVRTPARSKKKTLTTSTRSNTGLNLSKYANALGSGSSHTSYGSNSRDSLSGKYIGGNRGSMYATSSQDEDDKDQNESQETTKEKSELDETLEEHQTSVALAQYIAEQSTPEKQAERKEREEKEAAKEAKKEAKAQAEAAKKQEDYDKNIKNNSILRTVLKAVETIGGASPLGTIARYLEQAIDVWDPNKGMKNFNHS